MQEPGFNSWVRKIPWRRDRLATPVFLGFSGGSDGKESTRNAGDLGSIPGLGRSPGEGKGSPLQYFGLENSMDCIVHQLDGIPVELFQTLKDDAVKVLHSICQQIWKTHQWPQDWKRSVFILTPKKGNAKECSNYRTIALISHASKVLLKILQARL